MDDTKPLPTAMIPPAARRKAAHSIAARLRALRKEAGLTLSDLAMRSGLAASTLSKIENEQMSPTYDTILSLAEGLGVDITHLVTGTQGKSVNGRKAVTRKGEGIVHRTQQYDYEMLCNDIANRQFVPLLAEVKARSLHTFDGLLRHPGEEFIFVLEGRVELHTEFYAPSLLEVGDSGYFDSTMGHALINPDDRPARVLWVCSRVVGPLAQ
ncbi:XRE family transcriptional regulator (plasmid) [Ketogulonicigenium vulgare Y25]|uniref:Helix-turn-helix XRE-family-like protein n=1 Tax=Ketogulonicigenium vulgare (strain WSH-001) TaxID=759362 RepID=F9YBH1_KETVW|nr:XRE family transcriptional regulator [Ketogulonicigenium vulgare]ADO44286.1 XRE family transcriptional regulator [Ketogulonicigenium vulgare Y25]AEM42723.1 Helix-turn-helix XRE-family-like protein [Ketogulonicigenium vulgare WSH-001]